MSDKNKAAKKGSAAKVCHFLKGFASAFDITGTAFIEIPDFSTGLQRDGQALRQDWRRIGGDLRSAMNQVGHAGQ
ncbi:hypothetical protein AGMMS50267_11370 [Spirochaetia bacterium]|nr:hypothetical protein AGMMS50267_11370 [Spirochaetia bacterium]